MRDNRHEHRCSVYAPERNTYAYCSCRFLNWWTMLPLKPVVCGACPCAEAEDSLPDPPSFCCSWETWAEMGDCSYAFWALLASDEKKLDMDDEKMGEGC